MKAVGGRVSKRGSGRRIHVCRRRYLLMHHENFLFGRGREDEPGIFKQEKVGIVFFSVRDPHWPIADFRLEQLYHLVIPVVL